MNALIIDDEAYARENLRLILKEYCPDIEIIGEADNIISAEVLIRQTNFDFLFLDINLKNENSFSLIQKLYDDPTFFKNLSIVFVTAFDEFAVNAFKLNAINYILKPISINLLLESITRVKNLIPQPEKINIIQTIKENSARNIITIPYKDAWEIVTIEDIIYIEGDGAYSKIFTTDNAEIYTSKSLKEYEHLLSDYKYLVRIHKSYFVNINFVVRIFKKDGGYLELKNGKKIPVSNNLKKDIYELF